MTKKGGARPGAGRPKGEPTKTIQIRVPQSKYDVCKEAARDAVKALLK